MAEVHLCGGGGGIQNLWKKVTGKKVSGNKNFGKKVPMFWSPVGQNITGKSWVLDSKDFLKFFFLNNMEAAIKVWGNKITEELKLWRKKSEEKEKQGKKF